MMFSENAEIPILHESFLSFVEAAKILTSPCCPPWNKLESLNMFVLPRLDVLFRGVMVAKAPLKEAEKFIKRG